MDRYWASMLCVVIGLTGPARAEGDERVALFVVSDVHESATQVQPVVDQVLDQLAKDGRAEVHPELLRPGGNQPSPEDAKALGRSAVRQLGSQSPEIVLAEYAPKIREALTLVSATDGEGRAHLWNLCALHVHLLLSAASSDEFVRDAVLDCRRRFIERPALGKAWGQEVGVAFEKYTAETRQVPLSVKSSPAGCDLRLYGSLVGVTPMVIDVMPGLQEVQINCEGRRSAVHRVQVGGARDLVVRLGADAALVETGAVSWLRYADGRGAVQGLEDASVLASEASADSFVVMRTVGPHVKVEWVRVPASLQRVGEVPLTAAPDRRAAAIATLFRKNDSQVTADDVPAPRKRRRRLWADYALGGGLIAAGVAVSVYPLIAIARDGKCTDSSCDNLYRGKSAGGIALLAGASVLAAAGVAIVWVGPFGKRTTVTVANGVSLKGAF